MPRWSFKVVAPIGGIRYCQRVFTIYHEPPCPIRMEIANNVTASNKEKKLTEENLGPFKRYKGFQTC